MALSRETCGPCGRSSRSCRSATLPRLPGVPAPRGAWLASIEGISSEQPVLRVTGSPTPLLRSLPAQDCERVVEIAAAIVDGLPRSASESGPGHRIPRGGRDPAPAALGLARRRDTARPHRSGCLRSRSELRLGLKSFELAGLSGRRLAAGQPPARDGRTRDSSRCNYQAIPGRPRGGRGLESTPRSGSPVDSMGSSGLALVSAFAPTHARHEKPCSSNQEQVDRRVLPGSCGGLLPWNCRPGSS